jgi:hypothetical protein
MPRLHTSTREHATDAAPVDLTSEIQAALAALADVEARFEADQAQVEQLTGPVAWKARLRAGVEARRLRSREPLVQRLAALHREITSALMLKRLPLHREDRNA